MASEDNLPLIPGNYHTHTCFCDGSDPPETMVHEALREGLSFLGFSGHMDPDIHMDMPAYLEEIHRLRLKYSNRIRILCGVELDNLWGEEPWLTQVKDVQYIIGSTHFLPVDSPVPMSVDSSEEHLRQLAHEFFADDYYQLARAYYDFEARVFDRTRCTFIGHFDLVVRFNDTMQFLDEEDPRYLKPALEAMEALVRQDIPFEINCGALNRGRKKELYPNMQLLKALCDMKGRILINSDAHQHELLTAGFDTAVRRARACGFTCTSILRENHCGKTEWEEIPLPLI